MCSETIRRAIIEKFNEKGWQCGDFTDLYNAITPLNIKDANEIVDSIRICDPAVGSGHFLVSALNEIIAIKSELGILVDEAGKILKNCKINVENDELVIRYDNEFFNIYLMILIVSVCKKLFSEKNKNHRKLPLRGRY